MKKHSFTEEQIIAVLKEKNAGARRGRADPGGRYKSQAPHVPRREHNEALMNCQ